MPFEEIPVHSEPDPHGDGTRDTHPAFGVAVVTRGTGSGRTLFQSDLLHQETITLRIETAERVRNLNRDWVHPKKTAIEVEMSLAQWGQLVSSIGIGSGVPITIRYREQEQVPGFPYKPRFAESINEVRGSVSKILDRARETLAVVEDAFESKKGIKAMRAALSSHKHALAGAESNAEFAVKSAVEASENVVSQARADIEAHALRAGQALGLDSPVVLPELTQE